MAVQVPLDKLELLDQTERLALLVQPERQDQRV